MIGAVLGLTVLLGALPAGAQLYSDGYKFLKAVKDKDGAAVTEMIEEPGSTVEDNLRDVAVPRCDHWHPGSGEFRDRDRGAALRVAILREDARLQKDVSRPYGFEVPVIGKKTAPFDPVDDPFFLDEPAHPQNMFVFTRGPASDDHAKHNLRKIPSDALERQ